MAAAPLAPLNSYEEGEQQREHSTSVGTRPPHPQWTMLSSLEWSSKTHSSLLGNSDEGPGSSIVK